MARRTEHDVQATLCQLIKLQYPKALYFSDMAGVSISRAQRKVYSLRAGRGFPDFYLFEVMDSRFNGLMLELKREGEKSNIFTKKGELRKDKHLQEQLEKILMLRERGYCAGFAIGSFASFAIVKGYMNGDLEKINKYIYPQIKPIF